MKKYIREPFPALSHFLGVLLSIFGLISLLQVSGNSERATIAVIIYGVSLILLYLASTLAHSIHCSPKTEERLEKLDYAAIFILIAGTYTPICLLVIKGWLGWLLLSCEWLIAFLGIFSLYVKNTFTQGNRTSFYLVMGWMFIFALTPIISAVSNSLLMWLLGGAIFYSVGSIIFVTNKPTLWPGFFDAHDLWHIFVLAGSTSHFIFINRYISGLIL